MNSEELEQNHFLDWFNSVAKPRGYNLILHISIVNAPQSKARIATIHQFLREEILNSPVLQFGMSDNRVNYRHHFGACPEQSCYYATSTIFRKEYLLPPMKEWLMSVRNRIIEKGENWELIFLFTEPIM